MSRSTRVLAIEIDGTISAAIVDGWGKIYGKIKEPARTDGYPESITQIAELGRRAAAEASVGFEDLRAAGLIFPGVYTRESGEAWAPDLWGEEPVPLYSDLAWRMKLPVAIDCNRAGYILAESWLGAAQGLTDAIYLSLGNRIGAGILAGGRVIYGASGLAGSAGWFALAEKHKPEYAHLGCFEAEVREKPVEEILPWLARGIAILVSAFDPQMVILGGGHVRSGDAMLDRLRQAVTEWAHPISARRLRIEVSALGEDAGLLGAAKVALNPEF